MHECIVRMEMPENCAVCPFVTEYSRCVFLGMYAIDEERRADNCPIVCSLPEGHGELIDRSKLFDWYTGQRTKYPVKQDSPQFGTMMMYEIFGVIDDAPTIVPADAERSETCLD